MKRITPLFAIPALLLTVSAAAENTFLFGNSLTAGARLPEYDAELVANTQNPDWFIDQFTSPGTTLQAQRFVFEDRNRPKINALDGQWDSVVFQPYDRNITDPFAFTDRRPADQPDWGDANNISGLLEWFDAVGSDPTVYIYSHFPRITPGFVTTEDAFGSRREEVLEDYANFDYSAEWQKTYTDPTPERPFLNQNFETRDYFVQLLDQVRTQEPTREAFLIPVGDVLEAVDIAAENGEFESFSDVKELFVDDRHLQGGLPQYLKAATFYATILGQDLDALEWERYNNAGQWTNRFADRDFYGNGVFREMDQASVDTLNAIILDVVTRDPSLTGVSAAAIPEPATAGLLAIGGLVLLRRRNAS